VSRKPAVILLALVSGIFTIACGRSFSEAEFPSRQVTIGDVTYGYRIFVPANRQPGEHLPVMLYLHGRYRRGDDNQAQLRDLADIIRERPENFPYIIVFPQSRPEMRWSGPMMAQSLAALDQTVKEFDADESRLFLAGYSLGGFGVWHMAITHPSKFAALVSVAGGMQPVDPISDEDRALLSPKVIAAADSPDPHKAYTEVLGKTPVWVVHGSDDESVPVQASRKIVAALKAAGDTDVNFVELEGVGHDSVGQAFSDPRLGEWLVKQQLRNVQK
jgi:predicted peptidase